MWDQNLAIVEGRLTREPELKQGSNGNPYLKFSIACNGHGTPKTYNGRKEWVSYFDIIAWSELAESYSSKLQKGLLVRVVGPLSQWRWKDDSGKGHSKIHIKAQSIECIKTKKTSKEPVPY